MEHVDSWSASVMHSERTLPSCTCHSQLSKESGQLTHEFPLGLLNAVQKLQLIASYRLVSLSYKLMVAVDCMQGE